MPKTAIHKSPHREVTDERPAKAVKLWNQGLTTSIIAERLACSTQCVAGWLRAAGIRLDGKRREYVGQGYGTSWSNGRGGHVPARLSR